MKICIPTKNEEGLEAEMHEHFGNAPTFTLVDTDSGDVEVVRNSGEDRGHGTCHPIHELKAYALEAIVCRGMGRRAVESLKSEGIEVMIAAQVKVSDILAAVRSGDVKAFTPDMACQGGHRHHAHGDRHGRQRRR